MKNINEIENVNEFDAFEIIDLEEKLDYLPWASNGDQCACGCAGGGDRDE